MKDHQELREVKWMLYDNPNNPDGTPRKNETLGWFEIVHQIFEDCYSEEFVGRDKDGKYFLVTGREVSGIGGGVRYSVKEMPFIVNLILSERQAARVEFAKEIEHRFGRETSNARSHIARKDLWISIDRILANQDTTNTKETV